MVLAALLTVLLAAYNNVYNLLRPGRYSYVVVNLTTSAVLVATAIAGGLTLRSLGLSVSALGDGLTWGGPIAGIAGAGLILASVTPKLRKLMADQRVAGLSAAGLAYVALVRIPFGTVVLEEIAFRGVLLGAWARLVPVWWAVAISSAVFGLWHIVPSLEMLRLNSVHIPAAQRIAIVGGTCVLTACAGLFFGWLRIETGSVLAPMLVHAGINSFATLGAFNVHQSMAASRN